MAPRVVAAVDLGASSGRVVAGLIEGDPTGRASVELVEIHRFPNQLVERDGHLRWPFEELHAEVLDGLARLGREYPQVESIGIDTWGVDYGLIGDDGSLLADPIAYRDPRTDGVVDTVHGWVSPEELYDINGVQFLPFTTIYQLVAEGRQPVLARAAHALLLPDLVAHRLTGVARTELTNASTTGLLDVRTRAWSRPLLDRLGLPPALFPPLEAPGARRGELRPDVAARLGLPARLAVTTVGSHDTASAVAAVPATSSEFAFISSGTWSLVGLELDSPVVTRESRAANFTNELGVGGRTRFLRNVGGLWLLEECLRVWSGGGTHRDYEQLVAEASAVPGGGPTIDVDEATFIAPGDMPARIRHAVASRGQAAPDAPAAIARCIFDSLARAYARTVAQAASLAGRDVRTVHIVGGGSRNSLLCQLTADACGLPVVAGPAEATALGNVVVQAQALGVLPGSLDAVRVSLARDPALHRYEPKPAW